MFMFNFFFIKKRYVYILGLSGLFRVLYFIIKRVTKIKKNNKKDKKK